MNFTRSSKDNYISGVCGGLGEYTGIDPIIWRLAFVFLCPAAIGVYIVMSIFTEEK